MSQVSTPQSKRYTERDIERLDSQGKRYELIAGELIPMSPTSRDHGRETMRIASEISSFVDSHGLGETYAAETGFRLGKSPDTVLAPDFAYVQLDRLIDLSDEVFVACVPDLVVETRSPRDSKRQIEVKLQRWLDFEVPLVLDLDPMARLLTVYRPGNAPEVLSATDTLSAYDVLPGFSMPMSRVFR